MIDLPYADEEKQREYQKEWMREYRRRKKFENDLRVKIRNLPGYSDLSKEKQREIDEAIVAVNKRFSELDEEAKIFIKQKTSEFERRLFEALLEIGRVIKKVEA